MEEKKKVLNNNAIAVLLIINIIMSLAVLFDKKETDLPTNIAYAEASVEQDSLQFVYETNEAVTYEVAYEVGSVLKEKEKGKEGMLVYYSHKDDMGAYFTYSKTEQPEKWHSGYWYIPFETLALGYIKHHELNHNDSVKVVFFANEEKDYFQLMSQADIIENYNDFNY